EDQDEIARVDNQSRGLARDEHGVHLVHGVGEQNDAAPQAAIPERQRDYAAPYHLAPEPLDDEARGKQRLAEKSHQQPDVIDGEPLQQSGHHNSFGVSGPRKRRFSHSTPTKSVRPTRARSQTP